MRITETWVKAYQKDLLALKESTPKGFSIISVPRTSGRGGGLAMIYRQELNVKHISCDMYGSCEVMKLRVKCHNNACIDLVTIYRPPSLKFTHFMSDFSNILQQTVCESSSRLVCLGDFNVHIDTENDVKAKALKRLLDEFGLYQYVTFPTHVRGHTIDLVIGYNRHPQIIKNTRTLSHGSVESDNFPVCFNIMFKKPGKVKKILYYRKWSSLDVKQFADDIKENVNHLDTLTEVNDLVNLYNDVLSSAVTTQLPSKRKTIIVHPNCPYYNDTLRAEKQKRRSFERQWRRTSLSVHRQLYTNQCKLANRFLRQTKASYYKDKLKECKTDQKALFKVINDLMFISSTEGGIFPQASSLENRALAQRLNDFFIEKKSTK